MPQIPDPDSLLEEARKIEPRLVDLRRRIHQEPELGLETPATRAKILAELEDLGLEIDLHEKSSGIVATLYGGATASSGGATASSGGATASSGGATASNGRDTGSRSGVAAAGGSQRARRVLLRGDMDALPMPEQTGLSFRSRTEGRMHACGHDAHVAMLTGAARLLSARRDELAGDVVFMFQPGEEAYGGAAVMLEEGMPEADGCFALHVAPQIPTGMVGTKPGAIMASFDDFEIVIEGRGGHASMPHDCVDPIPIACEIVSALQAFVTRQIPATDPGVLTVAQFHAGTTNNVIAHEARLTGTMRALSDKTRALLLEGLPRIAEGIARTHNAQARVEITSGYPVVVNDAPFESFAREVVSDLLGEGAVLPLPAPIMGAEDFAYVLDRMPGAMLLLGVRPPGTKDPAPCHSSQMLLDEQAMALGSALHAAIATRFLAR